MGQGLLPESTRLACCRGQAAPLSSHLLCRSSKVTAAWCGTSPAKGHQRPTNQTLILLVPHSSALPPITSISAGGIWYLCHCVSPHRRMPPPSPLALLAPSIPRGAVIMASLRNQPKAQRQEGKDALAEQPGLSHLNRQQQQVRVGQRCDSAGRGSAGPAVTQRWLPNSGKTRPVPAVVP